MHRIPELFCGFHKRRGEGPTLYPVACSPQAWAAGSVFLLIEAALGLTIAAPEQRVTITGPRLPECIKWLNVRDLVIGDRTIDLHFERRGADVHVESSARDAGVELIIVN